MRWHAQVLHVAWKDVRQGRWLLLAYGALVVLATLRATLLFQERGPIRLVMPLLVVFGTLVCVFIVQADSPARSGAFWTSRPFHATALAAAKLATAATLLLLPGLAGQAIALRFHGVGAAALPPFLLDAILWYSALLLLAAAIAALTPDLRSFIVASVVLCVAEMFCAAMLRTDLGIPAGALLAIPVSALLVVQQYRTRSPRRGAVLAVPAFALIAMLPGPRLTRQPSYPDAPAGLRLARIVPGDLQASNRPEGFRRRRYSLELQAHGAVAGYRYVVRDATLALTTPDGSRTVLAALPVTLATPAASPLQWLNERAIGPSKPLTFFPASYQEELLLRRPQAHAQLRFRVVVERPREIAHLPYRTGTTTNHNGYRLRLVRVDPETPAVSFQMLGPIELWATFGGDPFWWSARLDYALYNRQRGEALALRGYRSSGGGDALVLPTRIPWQSAWTLSAVDRYAPADAARWLDGAELSVTEWLPVGAYTETLEVSIPS